MKTLYDLLGVDTAATQTQIEQGYKRQLDRYLERQSAGQRDTDTRRIQNVREAYLLLCSPQKRQIYDQQLRIFQKAKSQIFSRSNLFRAALLTLGILVLVGGIYMRHAMQDQAWNGAPPSSDQTAVSANSTQDGLAVNKEVSSARGLHGE